MMVLLSSLSVLGSAALVNLSNAAALDTTEEYESGTVHEKIMVMKMVCCLYTIHVLIFWS